MEISMMMQNLPTRVCLGNLSIVARCEKRRQMFGCRYQGGTKGTSLPHDGRVVDVSLNIKNPQAHTLATELAELTGESLTTAVIRSLEERLKQQRRRRDESGTAERIVRFADRFAAGMKQGCRSEDHAALLFGEDGLPR